jgi:hypothetical protein
VQCHLLGLSLFASAPVPCILAQFLYRFPPCIFLHQKWLLLQWGGGDVGWLPVAAAVDYPVGISCLNPVGGPAAGPGQWSAMVGRQKATV